MTCPTCHGDAVIERQQHRPGCEGRAQKFCACPFVTVRCPELCVDGQTACADCGARKAEGIHLRSRDPLCLKCATERKRGRHVA